MRLRTRNFDELEIEEEKEIYFKNGILGFEKIKRYIILENKRHAPFKWLQAVTDPDTAFVVIEPSFFIDHYNPDLKQEDLDELKLKDKNEACFYAIVVVPKNVENMTANLKAPIVINCKKRLGKQVVLEDNSYSVRHKILCQLRILNTEKENLKNTAVNGG
ncbi:MAG: flagellar assembly factor FliW [Thermosediminibacterales bacterium]|nr:flagellar assembly factor FliW [Thermosediminibacterales bacterium]